MLRNALGETGSAHFASKKGGSEGGGRVHPKGANSMAMSGLWCRKALVGTE